ncbi:MAG: dephospho-CoA kinase [Phascolarctobacterium sp.]|nr:dephospho-CoA kinase [Candidatus Phascolarctobacterium caballi]
MLLIGLTGGMASGKSTVAKYIREHGIPVFDADACSHQLTEKGGAAIADIAKTFGDEFIVDGMMNRKKMAELVFKNDKEREKLEKILLTMIWDRALEYINENKNAPAVAIDAPLLIEKGWHKRVDEIWLVYIPVAEQIRRVMIRDGMTEEHAKARIATQMTTDEKKPYADVVIDNSGKLEDTLARTDKEIVRVCKK